AVATPAIRAPSSLDRFIGGPSLLGRAALRWMVPGALLVAFLPGAGLRTLMANVRHLRDPAYDAHALAQTVMNDIPRDKIAAIDGALVLDFYLANRRVLEATIHRLSYDFRTQPFDYVVFARDGLRRFLPVTDGLALIRTYGD